MTGASTARRLESSCPYTLKLGYTSLHTLARDASTGSKCSTWAVPGAILGNVLKTQK